MKLFKKLLPLAIIPSATAVVVPLATSCSESKYTCEWDFTQGPWNASIPMKEGIIECTYGKGLEIYLNDCQNNKLIMAEDIVTSASCLNWSGFRIKHIGVKINDIDTQENRLTFDLDWSRWVAYDGAAYFQEVSATVKNLQYIFNDDDPWNLFDGAPIANLKALYPEEGRAEANILKELVNDDQWSIKMHETRWSATSEKEEFDYEFDADHAKALSPNTPESAEFIESIGKFNFQSSYMHCVVFYNPEE